MIKPISILIPIRFKDQSPMLWVQERKSKDELNGLWEFPGGKIEAGEIPEEAAARETEEETGVMISSDQIIRLGQYQFPPLVLFVHLYKDDLGLFPDSGYAEVGQLLSQPEKIPPNNIVFLEDINKRFQGVNPLK